LATPQSEFKRQLPGIVDRAYEQYKRNLPKLRTAADLMSKDIVTATPEMCLDDAAQLMGKHHIGSLIVTKYKTPVAIVTERDLMTKVLALGLFLRDQTVEEVMSYPLASISFDAKIKEVAQAMISKKSRLAVYDAGSLVGVVTAADLIKSLPDVAETEAKVDDFMSKHVVTADEENSVINVAKTMGSQRIGSVIITHNGAPTGIFTERDLLSNFLAKGKALFASVGPESSQPLTIIESGTSVHRAAATMALKHIRRLPITEGNKLVGIITARDLVEAYSR
jgi:CBS domain-containing protein